MQKFTLLFLCLAFLLGLNHKSDAQCFLPPPNNFHISAQGPGWVTLEWDIVPGAARYALDLQNLTTNQSWPQVITDDGTTNNHTYNGLTAGYYRASIRSICSNGTPAGGESILEFPNFIVIIDLVGGYSLPANAPAATPQCGMYLQHQSCNFNWSAGEPVEFRISRRVGAIAYSRFFTITPDAKDNRVSLSPQNTNQIGINTHNNGEVLRFTVSNYFAEVKIFHSPGDLTASVHMTANESGFILEIVSRGASMMEDRSDASAQSCKDNCLTFTSVNPFEDQINLYFAQTPQNPLTLTLCDAQGRLVKNLQISDPGARVSIPAMECTPGFYFLTVQGGKDIRTVKLVKL